MLSALIVRSLPSSLKDSTSFFANPQPAHLARPLIAMIQQINNFLLNLDTLVQDYNLKNFVVFEEKRPTIESIIR